MPQYVEVQDSVNNLSTKISKRKFRKKSKSRLTSTYYFQKGFPCTTLPEEIFNCKIDKKLLTVANYQQLHHPKQTNGNSLQNII